MDDLDPDQIRSRTFSQARRGYDRSEVDAFRDSVADQLAALAGELGALQSRLQQLGFEDPQDLKEEFDAVGSEVQAVLQAALTAAEEMRSRASADAARWRAEADRESQSVRDDAQAVSTALRTSAWETGVELLDQAREAAKDIIRVAEQDALLIRAEAERETLRMAADARRDAEEERRSARTEAERTSMEARAESEAILAAARQSAEAAQERARALEERRAELMKELESARESIGQMEQEIDSRREALYMAGVNEPSGMRVITPDPSVPDWDPDETGVRVVPVAHFGSVEPVDADAMADEVRMLRSGEAALVGVDELDSDEADSDEADSDEAVTDEAVTDEIVTDEVAVDELDTDELVADESTTEHPAASAVDEPGDEAASEVAVEVEAEAIDVAVTAEPADIAVPETATPVIATPESPQQPHSVSPPEVGQLETDEPGERDRVSLDDSAAVADAPQPSAAVPEPETQATEAAGPDDLSGLFASLRTTPGQQKDGDPQPPIAGSSAAATREVTPEPAAAQPDAPAVTPAPPHAVVGGGLGAGPAANAFEIRDRLLLPIQNRALRAVKRRLVDLQNRVLEELRVDGVDWEPETAMFRAALADELAPVRKEAFTAGFTAAAELSGHPQSSPPTGSVPKEAVPDFVAGLLEAISEAIHKARASHSGTRQASSAVSKVFRAWRTDEAERRVRWAARAAYHRGMAGGLAALGTPLVTSVVSGRLCGACPGCTTRSWDPAEWTSHSAPIPPATSECSATLVPVDASPPT